MSTEVDVVAATVTLDLLLLVFVLGAFVLLRSYTGYTLVTYTPSY